MKKIGISIVNGLLAEGIIETLRQSGGFQTFRIVTHRSNAVVNNCLIQEPDILLMEVSYADGATIDSRTAAAQELRRVCPTCKIVFLCDENSSPEIAKEVMTAKKDGLIDYFFFSSVTTKYLVAALESL